MVTIGDLVGKLPSGSGQIHGIHTDQRNCVKPVKPMNYGPFASFAPTFDSRFSTLSAEETQLVLHTYGDASSAEYAESILQFTKDSNYGTTVANGLLDILTNGEHSKSLDELYNMQLQSYEKREIEKCFTNQHQQRQSEPSASSETSEQIEMEYEKYKNTRLDFKRLRSLKELGIDIRFLDDMETDMKNFELSRRMQEHLSNNLTLIEKLRLIQNERLSQPLPLHLALVQPAGQEETQTAQQLTQQLSELAKKLPPSAIADQYALRKAMGMSYGKLSLLTTSVFLFINCLAYLQLDCRHRRHHHEFNCLSCCNSRCRCLNCNLFPIMLPWKLMSQMSMQAAIWRMNCASFLKAAPECTLRIQSMTTTSSPNYSLTRFNKLFAQC